MGWMTHSLSCAHLVKPTWILYHQAYDLLQRRIKRKQLLLDFNFISFILRNTSNWVNNKIHGVKYNSAINVTKIQISLRPWNKTERGEKMKAEFMNNRPSKLLNYIYDKLVHVLPLWYHLYKKIQYFSSNFVHILKQF